MLRELRFICSTRILIANKFKAGRQCRYQADDDEFRLL